MFEIAVQEGFSPSGCDVSPVMVDLAKRYCPDVLIGGTDAFEKVQGPYDAIVALNVLPYLSADDEKHFFKLARSRIAYDGVLVISHTNWLFDLVTFNRYTIEFFREHLLPTLNLDNKALDQITLELKGLLTDSEYPHEGDQKSERDALPKRRVDPFSYPDELKRLGWAVVKEEYINCFPVPPKLANTHESLRLARLKSHQLLESPTLKKIFCSQFQYALRKSASKPA